MFIYSCHLISCFLGTFPKIAFHPYGFSRFPAAAAAIGGVRVESRVEAGRVAVRKVVEARVVDRASVEAVPGDRAAEARVEVV